MGSGEKGWCDLVCVEHCELLIWGGGGGGRDRRPRFDIFVIAVL